jgi:hypothetical protein
MAGARTGRTLLIGIAGILSGLSTITPCPTGMMDSRKAATSTRGAGRRSAATLRKRAMDRRRDLDQRRPTTQRRCRDRRLSEVVVPPSSSLSWMDAGDEEPGPWWWARARPALEMLVWREAGLHRVAWIPFRAQTRFAFVRRGGTDE